MRILFANATRTWGGVKTWTLRLMSQWAGHGVACAVAARDEEFLARSRAAGANVFPFKFGMDYNPLSVAQAARILRHFKPDVMITNISKELRTFGLAARALGVPVVARLGLPKDLKVNFRTRWEYRNLVSHALVPCEAVKRGLPRELLPPQKITVIHTGTHIPGNPPPRAGKGPVRIVYAGKMTERKGLPAQLRVYRQLLDEGMPLEADLAGEGPLLESLKRDYRDYPAIRFPGPVADPASLYRSADIGVMHSEEEGFPNTLLEYMAHGLAIITTPVDGIPEMIADGREGLFVPFRDEKAFAEKLGQLITSPELRLTLGAAAFERARREFNVETQAQKILEFLEETARRP